MPIVKRVLCPQRLRQVPAQFSWVDHRLVRDRHIARCSVEALALYLFLVTVCDGQGLSYYSDASIGRLLRLDATALARARQELLAARLIAYRSPLYQVLALDEPAPQAPSPSATSTRPPRPPALLEEEPPREPGPPLSLGEILRQAMEHQP